MDNEKPINLEQAQEAAFKSWVVEFQGQLWFNPEAMPKGADRAVEVYEHFRGHQHKPEAAQKMAESAEEFKKLTGYDIQDLVRYKEKQGEGLNVEKK